MTEKKTVEELEGYVKGEVDKLLESGSIVGDPMLNMSLITEFLCERIDELKKEIKALRIELFEVRSRR